MYWLIQQFFVSVTIYFAYDLLFLLFVILGYYIHHIDNNLFLRKLEINWRPPEEYFLKVEVVDLPELDITDCEMDTISEIFSTEINNNNKKQNSEKQLIDVDIPKTPKQSLIFGCFGSRTKKHFSNKKNKR